MNKKKVNVDYGESKLEITVPEDSAIIRCEDPPPLPNPEKAFREALESPIGMPPIRELVHKGSKVTIAFDAPPRSGVPKRLFIPILLEELRRAGVPKENVTLICATGTQWKRTRDELYINLGAQLFLITCRHRPALTLPGPAGRTLTQAHNPALFTAIFLRRVGNSLGKRTGEI